MFVHHCLVFQVSTKFRFLYLNFNINFHRFTFKFTLVQDWKSFLSLESIKNLFHYSSIQLSQSLLSEVTFYWRNFLPYLPLKKSEDKRQFSLFSPYSEFLQLRSMESIWFWLISFFDMGKTPSQFYGTWFTEFVNVIWFDSIYNNLACGINL